MTDQHSVSDEPSGKSRELSGYFHTAGADFPDSKTFDTFWFLPNHHQEQERTVYFKLFSLRHNET